MNSEAWERLSEWHNAWLDASPDDREQLRRTFLADHPALEADVRDLVIAGPILPGFLETPAFALVLHDLADEEAPLASGTLVGPYQIVTLIAAGGMGQVYRATDVRLGRDVAIKLLSRADRHDRDRVERFLQEARITAAIDRPNIVRLFDVGIHDDRPFLVMELLVGETLRERLGRGRRPPDESRRVALDVAHGLTAAHAAGLVHRDLKPENLFLTRSGPTKILDFGVAKLVQGSPVSGNQAATVAGMLVGTAGYLAPEQILCEAVDARADLFAFGAILYEMLTGRSAFGREHAIDTLHAVLRERVPSAGGEPGVVPGMAAIADRLLEKDPDARFQSAADLAWTLERMGAASPAPPPLRTRRAPFRWGKLMAAAAIGAVTLLVAGLAAWALKPSSTPHPLAVARLSVPLPLGDTIRLTWPSVALSNDGRLLAYTAGRDMRPAQLFVRAFDSLDVTLMAGTEGAKSPFFSPDGRWIGFFAQGKLKKVLATGGGLQTVCDAASAFGGTWGADGSIYFAPFNTSGIWQVPASGGSPREVTTLDRTKGEVSHRWPQISPDGKVLFFTVWTGPGWDEKHLEARIADGGERRRLVQGASTGRYLSTGHLLYARNEELFVVPFDLAHVQATGPPVTLGDRASEQADAGEGAQIAASDNGTFAYVRSDARASDRRMVWVGADGKVEPLSSPPGAYTDPAISPDGGSVAVSIQGPTQNLWIYDLARSTLTTLPSAGSGQAPTWTPDGRRLIYRRTQGGYRNIFWRAADGSGEEERLTTADALQAPSTVSRDGVSVFFDEVSPETGRDMWMMRLDAGRQRQAVLTTRFNEWSARLSPDNRWLAYVSDESGRNEVYVRPYPAPGGRFPISTTGGMEPLWSRDGRELFYRNGDQMMAVTIASGSTPTPGAAHVLFEGHYQVTDAGVAGYDVASDRRFLMIESTVPQQPVTHITVVLNWFEELKRAVPGAAK